MQCWLMKYEVIIQRRQYEIERINRMYDEDQEDIRKRLAFAEAANVLLKDKQHKLIIQRRQYEIERINRMYDKDQEDIRKRLAFAEAANVLLKDKQHKLIKSKQENECYISQHDLEQIKSYSIQIKNSSFEKQENKNKSITNFEIINEPKFMISNILKTYSCPLIQPNVFGITLEHNIRFDCDGSTYNKSHLTRHLEYYHQMLPECALRLRNAIVNGQSSSDQIKLFSDNEIILNKEFFSDCPLTNATNIFGAQSSLSILMHIPCTKKQMALASMINHFQYYHKLKYNAAKKIFNAMKNKSLTSDIILFETNEHIGSQAAKENQILTMKLLAIFVLHKDVDKKVKILQEEFNLESFGYFQRLSVQQLFGFSARTVTERTALGTKQSVEADQTAKGFIHIYVRPDGLASVIIADSEYPQRVAHTLLSKVMDDFTNAYPPSSWANMNEQTGKMASLSEVLRKYQNPQEADPLMRLQKDLDDTKDILKKTLVNVLERGEHLDDLVDRSNHLSIETKAIYKTARKTNRCCTLF
ncbi:unnamed protein product [Rotaria sp. Silwood1]|nr:unnamed protein product [Rotaria sp. Silwood1]